MPIITVCTEGCSYRYRYTTQTAPLQGRYSDVADASSLKTQLKAPKAPPRILSNAWVTCQLLSHKYEVMDSLYE